MMPLHILRRVPPRINGRPVTLEGFVRLSRRWERQPAIRFGSWTARRPRRVDELDGGSVYYCHRNPAETIFRMELDCIERVTDFDSDVEEKFRSHWSFTCHPNGHHGRDQAHRVPARMALSGRRGRARRPAGAGRRERRLMGALRDELCELDEEEAT